MPSTAAYGAYKSQNGYCRNDVASLPGTTIKGYANTTWGDVDSLNDALAYVGPVSVSINANPDSFYFYTGGLYDDPECGGDERDLDHIVLAVGYVTVDGEKYTILKNSWSTNWGDEGYVFVKQSGNICGVADTPTYAVM